MSQLSSTLGRLVIGNSERSSQLDQNTGLIPIGPVRSQVIVKYNTTSHLLWPRSGWKTVHLSPQRYENPAIQTHFPRISNSSPIFQWRRHKWFLLKDETQLKGEGLFLSPLVPGNRRYKNWQDSLLWDISSWERKSLHFIPRYLRYIWVGINISIF